jgi:hypothetical protein
MCVRSILVLVIGTVLLGCGVTNKHTPDKNISEIANQNLNTSQKLNTGFNTLPSGIRIKITNISPFNFPETGPALVMYYETNIPIENLNEVRKEVDEIWQIFREDAEAAKVKTAAIRAVHNETEGFIKNGKGYGFVFLKRDDGTWYCTADEKK